MGPKPVPKRPRKGTRDSQPRPLTNHGSVRTSGSVTPTRGLREPASSAHAHDVSKKSYRRVDEEHEWWRVVEGQTEEQSKSSSTGKKPKWDYQTYRAPPINDLHPPIISIIPTRAEERRWMKEPPPSHAFINGRIGVNVIEASAANNARSKPVDRRRSQGGIDAPIIPNRQSLANTNTDLELSVLPPAPAPALVSESSQGLSTITRVTSAPPYRRKSRPQPLRLYDHPPTSDSDADDDGDDDDDDEDDDESYPPAYLSSITRPLPTHRALDSDSRPSTSSNSNRRSLPVQPLPPPTTAHTTTSHHRSPNSESRSPQTSPRSATSIPSPASSTDLITQSPMLAPIMPPSSQPPSQQPPPKLRPTPGRYGHPLSSADSAIVLEDEASPGADSSMDWKVLVGGWEEEPEEKTRERMWLGPRPEGRGRGVGKRWSNEF
jgi:hypothetical protein